MDVSNAVIVVLVLASVTRHGVNPCVLHSSLYPVSRVTLASKPQAPKSTL